MHSDVPSNVPTHDVEATTKPCTTPRHGCDARRWAGSHCSLTRPCVCGYCSLVTRRVGSLHYFYNCTGLAHQEQAWRLVGG